MRKVTGCFALTSALVLTSVGIARGEDDWYARIFPQKTVGCGVLALDTPPKTFQAAKIYYVGDLQVWSKDGRFDASLLVAHLKMKVPDENWDEVRKDWHKFARIRSESTKESIVVLASLGAHEKLATELASLRKR